MDYKDNNVKRVKQGAFYTPTPIVDLMHKYLEKAIGVNFREVYTVYDPAWGEGSLTKDYTFNDLIVSTLEQADLDITQDINPEAIKFQANFLEDTLPQDIVNKLADETKPRLVLMNPPYKGTGTTAGAIKHNSSKYKAGKHTTKTSIKKEMLDKGIRGSNLYIQFIYRAIELMKTSGIVAVLSPIAYLTGQTSRTFRAYLKEQGYGILSGFAVSVGMFEGIKADRPIVFTILQKNPSLSIDNFVYPVYNKDLEIIDSLTLYNTDDKLSLSDWLKEVRIKEPAYFTVAVRSPLNYVFKGRGLSKQKNSKIKQLNIGYIHNQSNDIHKSTSGVNLFSTAFSNANGEAIGYIHNQSNDIKESISSVNLFSTAFSNAHGEAIGYIHNQSNDIHKSTNGVNLFSTLYSSTQGEAIQSNIYRVILLFSFRRSCVGSGWYKIYKQYLKPTFRNQEHENQVFADALIYALFNSSNNTSSLRDLVDPDGNTHNVYNHFFPYSKELFLFNLKSAKETTGNNGYDVIYNDFLQSGADDTIIHKLIKHITNPSYFSQEALDVYNKSVDLYIKAFPYLLEEKYQTKVVSGKELKTFLNRVWNPSWYQLKLIYKEEFSNELKELQELYQKLHIRMRQHTIDCGVVIPD